MEAATKDGGASDTATMVDGAADAVRGADAAPAAPWSAAFVPVGAQGALLPSVPCGFVGSGHPRAVAISPDGSSVALGIDEGFGKLFRASDGHELGTLSGHRGAVGSVAWSADGALIATASLDGTIGLWHVGGSTRAFALEAGSPQRRVVVTGDKVIAGGDDGVLRVWSTVTGALVRTMEGHAGPVTALAVVTDGTLVASGGADQTVRLWDLSSGQTQRIAHTGSPVSGLAGSAAADVVAAGLENGRIELYKASTADPIRTLIGHVKRINSVVLGMSGASLTSGSDDGHVKRWRLSDGAEVQDIAAPGVLEVSLNGDQTTIASAEATPVIRAVATGQVQQTLGGPAELPCRLSADGNRLTTRSVAQPRTFASYQLDGHQAVPLARGLPSCDLSSDGTFVAAQGSGNQMTLYATDTGQMMRSFDLGPAVRPGASFTANARTSTDGTQILVYGRFDFGAVGTGGGGVFQTDTGQLVRALDDGNASAGWANAVLSPDRAWIGGVALTGAAALRDAFLMPAATGTVVFELKDRMPAMNPVSDVAAFSPDSARFAFSSNGAVLVDVGGEHPRRALSSPTTDLPAHVRFRHGGDTLVTSAGDQITVWRVADGGIVNSVWPGGVAAADGSHILGVSPASIDVWDASTGAKLASNTPAPGATAFELSDDGAFAVLGGAQVEVWKTLPTPALVGHFAGHAGGTGAVDVVDSGQIAVSGGADKLVRLHHPSDGSTVSLAGHGAAVVAVALSADGSLAASADGLDVRLWRVASGQPAGVIPFVHRAGLTFRLRFSPDGARLAAITDDRVTVVATADGQTMTSFDFSHPDVGFVEDLSPTLDRLLTSQLRLFRLSDGAPLQQFIAPDPNALAFSTEGLVSAGSGYVQLYDTSGALLDRTPLPADVGVDNALSGDGRRLVNGGWVLCRP
jgi:WD40 repeat protein